MNGILISLEGPDGAGKTTVLNEILPELEKINREVLVMREPGGVRIAEEIREIILNPKNTEIDSKTELLLYVAARRLLMKERIFPNLQEGKLVILDRFIDSAVAYQGYGRDLGVDVVHWLNDFVTDGLKPDLTIYFDIDTDIALERIMKNRSEELNRLDLERSEMHKKVRQGYLKIVEAEPERFVKINANQPLDKVVKDTLRAIKNRFSQEFK